MKTEMNQDDNREKERDRRGRNAGRSSRFSDADSGSGNAGNGGGNRERSRERRNCRVYISNIPYDYRWQDLKDLFRKIVGSVEYVELFHDESGKSRGCGIVEFKDPDNVEVALEKMNRYDVNGRELVVKEDHGVQRDQYGRIARDGGGGGGGGGGSGGGGGAGGSGDRGGRDDRGGSGRNFNMPMSNDFNSSSGNHNLYGLSASFLEALGITGPLHNKVFVANLDYKVDSKKLKQVFKLAGKVQSVDLSLDKDGNSRGFAVIEYDHPVEAVQAISMLDRQMLYDRRMTVRLDRIPDKGEGLKLPDGLGGVGLGLGPNGEPLRDVANNLPSIVNQSNQTQMVVPQQQQQLNQQQSVGGMMGNNAMNAVNSALFNNPVVQPVTPVTPVVQGVVNKQPNLLNNLSNLSSSNLAALSNVVGGLGGLGAALSNPLLTSSLNNLGLNLGQQGGIVGSNNDDSMPSSNQGLSNNYTSGNNYSSGYGGSSSNYNQNMGGGNPGVVGGSGNVGGGSVNLDNDYKSNNMDMFPANVGGNAANTGNMNAVSARKSDTIIIKNLPLSCTWQTLRDKFRDVGEVKFAEIRGNDVGVVRFFKERDAELAIAIMDGSRLDGRTIKVNYF